MSDKLYPEDILKARPSLRQLALDAVAAVKAEEQRRWDSEVEDLIAEISDLMDRLGLPKVMLEDVSFTYGKFDPQRPYVAWTMDDIDLRVRYKSDTNQTPVFEAKIPGGYATSWKEFTDLASLGAQLPAQG